MIGESTGVTKPQVHRGEKSADLCTIHHYQPILLAFHVPVLCFDLVQAKSDFLSVDNHRPKLDDRQEAKNLRGDHFHVLGQIFTVEVRVNHMRYQQETHEEKDDCRLDVHFNVIRERILFRPDSDHRQQHFGYVVHVLGVRFVVYVTIFRSIFTHIG